MKILCKISGHPNGQYLEIHWKYIKGKPYMIKILCKRCRQPL